MEIEELTALDAHVGQGHQPAPRAAARQPALPQAPQRPAGAADRHRRRADLPPRARRRGLLLLPAAPADRRLRRARARQRRPARRADHVLPARRGPRPGPVHRLDGASGSTAGWSLPSSTTSAPRSSAPTSARAIAGRQYRLGTTATGSAAAGSGSAADDVWVCLRSTARMVRAAAPPGGRLLGRGRRHAPPRDEAAPLRLEAGRRRRRTCGSSGPERGARCGLLARHPTLSAGDGVPGIAVVPGATRLGRRRRTAGARDASCRCKLRHDRRAVAVSAGDVDVGVAPTPCESRRPSSAISATCRRSHADGATRVSVGSAARQAPSTLSRRRGQPMRPGRRGHDR